nr:Glucose-methanol-choline oxidoreductase [Pandoravirus aubagnensis]
MHACPEATLWVCRLCSRQGNAHRQRCRATKITAVERDHAVDTGVYDYIVVGAGAAGSAHARALSDDPTVSVLVLDWGPDRRADATAADLLRGAEAAHDPGTSIRVGGAAEPGLLGARCALGGGRAIGGSTLVDSALWGTGGPREWRDFAKACKRAGPKRGGADVWLTRLAAAASVPLARVEAYVGPCDAPLGGAPSSSSTASAVGPYNNNNNNGSVYNGAVTPVSVYLQRRHWDPGGDARRLFVSSREIDKGYHHGDQRPQYNLFREAPPAAYAGGSRATGNFRGDDNNGDVDNNDGGGDDDDDGGGCGDDDDIPDWPMRGTRGRVTVRALAPAWDALSDSFVKAAGRVYGVREVVDHNGASQFGVTRHVQFAVRLGPPHGFNRQPAGDAFVGRDAEGERCVSCGRRRRLVVLGGALVERVLFETTPPAAARREQGRPEHGGGIRPSHTHNNGHHMRGHRDDVPSSVAPKPRAVGVIYLERGVRPVKVRARCRVVLCASALTPAVLQRSGIGDPRLLAGIGTSVVFANPAVGTGYHCPYGFRMVASVVALDPNGGGAPPDVRSDLNPPGTIGMVFAQDATRPSRRRRQWCVLAAAGPLPDYWPVAGDPLVRAASRWAPFGMQSAARDEYRFARGRGANDEGDEEEEEERTDRSASAADAWCAPPAPGPAVITLSAWLLDPTSRGGAIETPSSDPSVLPRARLGLYTDVADMQSMRALARSVARLVDTMPPTSDGHRLTLAHPTAEVVADDDMLDLWLRTEAFYVAHRHGGVCRVGPSPEHRASTCGVVDGLLRVHGVDGLSVCDSTVFDQGMGVGTTAGTAAVLATAYAGMLLDGIVDGAHIADTHFVSAGRGAPSHVSERPLPSSLLPTAQYQPQSQRRRQHQEQRQPLHGRPPADPAADRLFVRITQQQQPPPSQPLHALRQPQAHQRQRQENTNAQHRTRAVRPDPLRAHQRPPARSAFAFVTAPSGQDDPKVAPPVPAQRRRRHR